MTSLATRRFWHLFGALPVDVQELAATRGTLRYTSAVCRAAQIATPFVWAIITVRSESLVGIP